MLSRHLWAHSSVEKHLHWFLSVFDKVLSQLKIKSCWLLQTLWKKYWRTLLVLRALYHTLSMSYLFSKGKHWEGQAFKRAEQKWVKPWLRHAGEHKDPEHTEKLSFASDPATSLLKLFLPGTCKLCLPHAHAHVLALPRLRHNQAPLFLL